jgi:hypothetical protein
MSQSEDLGKGLTREERETCILVNDNGEVVIWTNSPVRLRQLSRRLGVPNQGTVHGSARWHFTEETAGWMPRRKRSGAAGTRPLSGFAARKPVAATPAAPEE